MWQACALWGAWAAVGGSRSAFHPLCPIRTLLHSASPGPHRAFGGVRYTTSAAALGCPESDGGRDCPDSAPFNGRERGAGAARACAHPTAPGPPSLAQADDLQVLPKFVLDPLAALQLGVHKQWPPLGAAEDGSVLGRSAVTGQPLIVPGSHIGRVREEAEGVQAWGDGDGHLQGGAVGYLAAEGWEPRCWWAWRKEPQALWDGTCGLSPSAH